MKDYGGKKHLLHPFGPLCSDVWSDIFRVRHAKNRDEHPCQLPLHLLERIILMSSEATQIILDPFMGTGTTALAAKRLGRNYMGFEKDSKYVEIVRKKLENENFISKIDNFYVSFHLNEIITLRECDWQDLKESFVIPKNIKEIDTQKIRLKNKNNMVKEREISLFDELRFAT